jgi:hypothetical protein
MVKFLRMRGYRERRPDAGSLGLADTLFISPRRVRTAVVLEDLSGWRNRLEAIGVTVVAPGGGRSADAVVAPAGGESAAISTGAGLVLVKGRGEKRAFAEAGYAVRRYLLAPSIIDLRLVIPVEHPRAGSYALRHGLGAGSRRKRFRNAAVAFLLRRRVLPPVLDAITVGLKEAAPPLLLAEAARFGVPRNAEWFLAVGSGDKTIGRSVFFAFAPNSSRPAWVVKFLRIPDHREPFERDERGLRIAEREPLAAAHAPRLLGRFELDGIHASVETAALGEELTRYLAGNRPPRHRLQRVEEVADWIVALSRSTLGPPEALGPELERLERVLIPFWRDLPAPARLLGTLAGVRPVLAHNDLGCWNVLVTRDSFTVLDWEAAVEHGLPLWDLVQFLTDAFATFDRVGDMEREDYLVRLFRGELPHSRLLFAWLGRGVEAADVPASAVGPIVTLGWLHRPAAQLQHALFVPGREPAEPRPPSRTERFARRWLAEPGLGDRWDRWAAG